MLSNATEQLLGKTINTPDLLEPVIVILRILIPGRPERPIITRSVGHRGSTKTVPISVRRTGVHSPLLAPERELGSPATKALPVRVRVLTYRLPGHGVRITRI